MNGSFIRNPDTNIRNLYTFKMHDLAYICKVENNKSFNCKKVCRTLQ